MDVGMVSYGFQANYSALIVKCNGNFSLPEKEKGFSDELSLYQDICKKYPDVSFRMEDYQLQGEDITSDFSFYQTKDGFSNSGVPSISIDKNLLTKALTDKHFEKELRENIENVVYNYNSLTSRGPDDPPYRAIDLTDNNGEIQVGITWANEQFSTDEQLKQMWHVSEKMDNKAFMKLICQIQQETTEQLFQIQSSHKYDLREILRTYEESRKLSAQDLKEKKDWRDMSGEEWDKMIEGIDNYLDAFKEQLREMKEMQDEASQKAALVADPALKTTASSSAALAVANGFNSGETAENGDSEETLVEEGVEREKNWTKKLKTDDQTILMTANEAQKMERTAAAKIQDIQLNEVTAAKISADFAIAKYMRDPEKMI